MLNAIQQMFRPTWHWLSHRRKVVLRVGALSLLLVMTGCHTVGYYAHAIHGQCQILYRQRPVDKILADTNTPPHLKVQLQLAGQLRQFAQQELKLPANGHYLKYADLGRPYVVWNVYAAPEFSLEAKTWWYPMVGRLKYQGYFNEAKARRYADQLARKGYDVYVGGTRAYSTLGWFRDPLLNTFIFDSEAELAELLFHELAHQRLFVPGDTDFSEAFSEVVAAEGVRRWVKQRDQPALYQEYQRKNQREQDFVELALRARAELDALYQKGVRLHESTANGLDRESMPVSELRQKKQAVLERFREECSQLGAWRSKPGGPSSQVLNNARLNSIETYYRYVPAFQRLLEQQGHDLGKFYQEATKLAKLKKPERHRHLGP